PGALRYRHNRLARPVLGVEVLQLDDEAVASGRRQEEEVVVPTHQHAQEGGARRRFELRGERFSLAARRGEGVGGERIAAAGRVEEDRGLVAPPLGRLEEGVPRLVRELPWIELVPLGRAYPALLGEHDGDRLDGDERRLVERLGRLAGDDRRAPGVAELLGVGLDLLPHLAAQPRLGGEDLLQAVALLRQRGLLAADLDLLQT